MLSGTAGQAWRGSLHRPAFALLAGLLALLALACDAEDDVTEDEAEDDVAADGPIVEDGDIEPIPDLVPTLRERLQEEFPDLNGESITGAGLDGDTLVVETGFTDPFAFPPASDLCQAVAGMDLDVEADAVRISGLSAAALATCDGA